MTELTPVVSLAPPVHALTQRDFMRTLFSQYGNNEEVVCHEYARAEERGQVQRRKNDYCRSGLRYARALWRDGLRRGWLKHDSAAHELPFITSL